MAFAGFRHRHIYALYDKAARHPDVRIAAACEEDPAARAAVHAGVPVTHASFAEMLDIQGKPAELNTAAVLAASRTTLDIQAAADQAERV